MARPAVPCCLLLDVSLPGANGLEVQRQVRAAMAVPIVCITGRPDLRVTVEAMKGGAVDVLEEPVNPEQLLGAVDAAILLSQTVLHRDTAQRSLRSHYASLTRREREVMALVVSGS